MDDPQVKKRKMQSIYSSASLFLVLALLIGCKNDGF